MATATAPDPIYTILIQTSDDLKRYDTLLRKTPTFNSPEVNEGMDEATIAAAEAALDLSPIVRANGEKYFPRKLPAVPFGVQSDVTFICKAYESKMPVLLYGSPGTGKTALFEAALPNLVTMVGTAETETSDFIGSYVQATDGSFPWVDGPLTVAVENGFPILIDEIALIDPRVMAIVYSLMDGRDELPITANPARGTIKAKEGFMVFGACNPNVPGAVMSDALLSRFRVHVEVQTDWSMAKKLGVQTKIIAACKNLEAKAKTQEIVAAPQLREVLTFRDVSAAYGDRVAVANFIAQARPEDRDTYAETLSSLYGDDFAKPLTFGN